MKEYIEREAALEVVHDDEVVLAAPAEARRIIREKLEELPAEEVEPVVRCRDCIFFVSDVSAGEEITGCIGRCCGWVDPDWYCGDGERKSP